MRRNRRYLLNVFLATTGFILSPLSWWNDLVVNVPLAYLCSLPFSLIDERLFLPGFILGYWLTNLLGFLLLHLGGEGLILKKQPGYNIKRSLLVSIIYTVLMVVFVMLGWLTPPSEYLHFLES